MIIRLISVSDQLQLPEFHDIFRAILSWTGDPGYIIRIHGQEFNSFRRKTPAGHTHTGILFEPRENCTAVPEFLTMLVTT
jgi:hypothetical protein